MVPWRSCISQDDSVLRFYDYRIMVHYALLMHPTQDFFEMMRNV
jgi:hypothetical protein